jgi:dolichyl-diphosphooligosaccharide--protein glycosyltransferase
MSLNDVCCYIPAWFGAIATMFTALIAYECSLPVVSEKEGPYTNVLEQLPILNIVYKQVISPVVELLVQGIEFVFGTDFGLRLRSTIPTNYGYVDLSSPAVESALIAGFIMSVVPAHMMRSIGGGYDNESVAMTAMTMTFYLWTRTLRGDKYVLTWKTWIMGALTGVSYFYMVAVWGGYVFVLNLIGAHAGLLFLFGRYSTKLYRAYTAFYLIGTALAIQVPVVGMTPLKSLEQLGPGVVFLGFQVIEFVESIKRRRNLSVRDTWKLRVKVFCIAFLVFIAAVLLLNSYDYFGPISSRVRALFVKHTKTGNPLVDSVAEHQPAQKGTYSQYLGSTAKYAPFGFLMVAFRHFHDSSSFLLVYGLATYYFSFKMVRLILLTSPVASVLAGMFLGRIMGIFLYNIFGFIPSLFHMMELDDDENVDTRENAVNQNKKSSSKSKKKKQSVSEKVVVEKNILSKIMTHRSTLFMMSFGLLGGYVFQQQMVAAGKSFYSESYNLSEQLSNPSILMKGRLKSGKEVIIDDYRECYWWIRDNTPPDARIMAWWDYGYQLTAIANRTTIADGNTWNHEHIALLGRILTNSEKEGHRIARHMADYILVWSGGGGDDVAKSPHLRRIANSVYRHLCPDDPVCTNFGFTKYGPSQAMQESLLYKLVNDGVKPGVRADPNRFTHAFISQYGKCRVFKIQSVSQESKEFAANPANRKCDAPGSWFCPGQYPPALTKILAQKRDFTQLENFKNKEDDSEYQKKYFENLNKRTVDDKSDNQHRPPTKLKKAGPEEIEELNKVWEDNEMTSLLWKLIASDDGNELTTLMMEYPQAIHMRSSDGRGPLFWAYEFGNEKFIKFLKRAGVREDVRDAKGMRPIDLLKKSDEL